MFRAKLSLKCLIAFSVALSLASISPAAVTGANLSGKPDAWFSTDEGVAQIDHIISWQRPEGGWEKGYDPSTMHQAGKPFGDWSGVGTIDNGLTYTELRDLARAYNLTHRQVALDAFNRGLDYLLAMQYPNGGWPQRFPLPDNYGLNITFNDNAMVNVMRLLRDIYSGADKTFAFVEPARKEKAKLAFDRGIQCILKAQVDENGILTAWPQQCDPQTLAPARARAYELPSLSGAESSGVVRLLMEIDDPSPEVQRSVRAAVEWYEKSQITGKRVEMRDGDRIVVDDPAAEPIWARFYELGTNRPFFCGRDGVKKYSLAEIEKERRTGYSWYGNWGRTALNDYAKWSKKHPGPTTAGGK